MSTKAPAVDPADLPEIPDTEVMDVAIERYTEFLVASNERAVPDVRDGLKPVHRRILLGLRESGASATSRHYKSAQIVGLVLGRYHPHGDTSVYDAAVKMSQNFALRYPLVDGQGNFGSIDGDGAAAYRYTEMRITAAGDEMLRDLENRPAGIVPWGGNFTNEYDEPHVIPSRFPQLLCNGILTGIGTGYSSMWLPHNLREVVDAVIAVVDDPTLDAAALSRWIKGPDFPTGGMLMGTDGFMSALITGKGSVTVRAKMAIEESGRDTLLVVTEIPWQKEKGALIEQITLAGSKDKNGKAQVEGIIEVADESGNDWRTDMRIAIRLRKDANPQVVANLLYKYTALQTNFSYHQMAYVDGYPAMLDFRQTIGHYIAFQLDVLTARTTWRRKKALDALEVQEAYLLADQFSNQLVPLARSAANRADLETKIPTLIKQATPRQCEVIAGMPLYRFSKIDTDGVKAKIVELKAEIAEYDRLLGSKDAMNELFKSELRDVKSRFGDERRTEINTADSGKIKTLEEIIPDEPCYLAVSSTGLISRLPTTAFKAQKRGGAGVSAVRSEDDSITALLAARTRERVWMITDAGNVYVTRVADIEETARGGRGMNPKRLASVGDTERVVRLVTPPADGSGELVVATARGKVIRTRISDYANLNAAGLRAINVLAGDRLVGAALGAKGQHLLFVTSDGYAVRCDIDAVSIQGRGAQGVASVALGADAEVISLDVVDAEDRRDLLSIASVGKGKRSRLSEYPTKSRATKGVTGFDLATAGKGKGARVAFSAVVSEGEDLLVATKAGKVLVCSVDEIRRAGRATGGVAVVTPGAGDEVTIGAIIRSVPAAAKPDKAAADD